MRRTAASGPLPRAKGDAEGWLRGFASQAPPAPHADGVEVVGVSAVTGDETVIATTRNARHAVPGIQGKISSRSGQGPDPHQAWQERAAGANSPICCLERPCYKERCDEA